MTDQTLLGWCQAVMLEPRDGGATWPSNLWTASEVLSYVVQRQNRFLQQTSLVGSWQDVPVAPGQYSQPMPEEWIQTTRVAYANQVTGGVSVLVRSSSEAVDLLTPDWRQELGVPRAYMEYEAHTDRLWVAPPPLVGGVLHVLGVALAEVLDGSGISLTVPDEFAPYLKYGVLADMFAKEGRTFDPGRRDYCEQRYQEGVELATLLMEGLRV